MTTIAEAVSHKDFWKYVNTAEKSLRTWQQSALCFIALGGATTLFIKGRAFDLSQSAHLAGQTRLLITASKTVRDLGFMQRGVFLLSVKEKDGTLRAAKDGEAADYHNGSLGKQCLLFPTFVIACFSIAHSMGVVSLGKTAHSWLSSLGGHCWMLANGCECIDQWTRSYDKQRTEKSAPNGRLGATSEFAVTVFSVALHGLVPKAMTHALYAWTGIYWLAATWGPSLTPKDGK